MKISHNFLGILLAVMLVVLVFGQEARATNTRENCSFNNGTVCTNISDNLAAGATGINPAQTVNLSFSVYKQADASSPNCSEGRQLFNAVRHYIAGNATNYDYLSAGSGQDMEYEFSSGLDQQDNRYAGVFYCWRSSQGTLLDDTFLNSRRGESQTWSSPEFHLRTRATTIDPICSTITSCASYPVQNDCTGNRCSLSPACRWTGTACVGVTTANPASQNIIIYNPIGTNTFEELVRTIAVWIFNLSIPIAVAVIIYAGVLMLSAGANPARFKKGAEVLKYAVIGLAVVLIGEGFIALIRSIINLKNN